MKNVIFLKKDIPNRIKKEVRYWNLFAKFAPFAFAGAGFVCYKMNMVNFNDILVIAGILFAITAISWWFWTINTIGHISDRVHKAEDGIQDVLTDLKVIRQLFQDIKDNRK
jgi:hypothetical protein